MPEMTKEQSQKVAELIRNSARRVYDNDLAALEAEETLGRSLPGFDAAVAEMARRLPNHDSASIARWNQDTTAIRALDRQNPDHFNAIPETLVKNVAALGRVAGILYEQACGMVEQIKSGLDMNLLDVPKLLDELACQSWAVDDEGPGADESICRLVAAHLPKHEVTALKQLESSDGSPSEMVAGFQFFVDATRDRDDLIRLGQLVSSLEQSCKGHGFGVPEIVTSFGPRPPAPELPVQDDEPDFTQRSKT
jgi:hypothetical protein